MGVSDYSSNEAENTVIPGSPDIVIGQGGDMLSGHYRQSKIMQRMMADIKAAYDELDTRGQQTISIPAGSLKGTLSDGAEFEESETSTNAVQVDGLLFDASSQEYAQFALQMPKGWNRGTLIAQFIWAHGSTMTNFGVRWGIQAVAFGNGDALDAAFGAAQEVSDTGGTAETCYISDETAALTVAGSPGAEEWVIFRVYRDPDNAADTMAVDAKLLGLKIHYTTNASIDA